MLTMPNASGKIRVVIVGPSTSSKGGISEFTRQFLQLPWPAKLRFVNVATQIEGPRSKKLVQASLALVRMVFLAPFADAVFVQMGSELSIFRKCVFILLAHLFRKPVISYVHAGDFIDFLERQPRLVVTFLRLILQGCKVCAFLTHEHVEYAKRNLSLKNSIFLPNFVAAESVSVTPKTQVGRPNVLFLGRVVKEKGIFELINAFELLAERKRDISLSIAGAGEIDHITRLINEKGLSEHVHLHGWMNEDQKKTALAEATILVLPSYFEAMPLCVLEAMAAGTVVIASGVGAVPFMLEDGQCGIILPKVSAEEIADSIERCLDGGNIDELQDRAKKRFKKLFSKHVFMSNFQALIN
jgi:glycosyltransferase involved in cell wall biosynthesis